MFVNTVCYCSVLLYIHHLSLGYWKHKNLKALKTQRTISHPGKYIFSGMILCLEQFVPSENKVLACQGGKRKQSGMGRWSLQAPWKKYVFHMVPRGKKQWAEGLTSLRSFSLQLCGLGQVTTLKPGSLPMNWRSEYTVGHRTTPQI